MTRADALALDGALQASSLRAAGGGGYAAGGGGYAAGGGGYAERAEEATPQTLPKGARCDTESPHKNNEDRLRKESM